MPTDEHYFIEQTNDGRFTVRAKSSERASDSPEEALARVKELNPNDHPDVEREFGMSHRAAVTNGEPTNSARRVLGLKMEKLRLSIVAAIVVLIAGTALCVWLV